MRIVYNGKNAQSVRLFYRGPREFLLGKSSGRGKSDGWCPLLLRAERQTEACPEKEESRDNMMI
jgi:hypothetical protein